MRAGNCKRCLCYVSSRFKDSIQIILFRNPGRIGLLKATMVKITFFFILHWNWQINKSFFFFALLPSDCVSSNVSSSQSAAVTVFCLPRLNDTFFFVLWKINSCFLLL